MGTLSSQPARDYLRVSPGMVTSFLKDAVKIANECGVTVSDVIEAERVLQMDRQNSLSVRNGDVLDEQLAGFGELIRELIDAVRELKGSERV